MVIEELVVYPYLVPFVRQGSCSGERLAFSLNLLALSDTPLPSLGPSQTPTPASKRLSYLSQRPPPSTLLLPLLTSFNLSLQRALSTLASLSSLPPLPSSYVPTPPSSDTPTLPTPSPSTAGPTLLFLLGPSLLLPKALFGVQLPPLLSSPGTETENTCERTQRWDTIERAVLRGLVQMRSREGNYGGDGIGESERTRFRPSLAFAFVLYSADVFLCSAWRAAPTSTHLLLLAPRSFSSPLWLPRATLSPRLFSLLFAPPPPAPPLSSSSRMLKKKKGIDVEFVRVRVDGNASARVEDGRGTRREVEENGEEGEMICFVWEGGTVAGWRE